MEIPFIVRNKKDLIAGFARTQFGLSIYTKNEPNVNILINYIFRCRLSFAGDLYAYYERIYEQHVGDIASAGH